MLWITILIVLIYTRMSIMLITKLSRSLSLSRSLVKEWVYKMMTLLFPASFMERVAVDGGSRAE